MKYQKIINVTIVLVPVVFLAFAPVSFADQSAANQSAQQPTMKDVKREVADAAKAIKDYSFAQRDQAVKKVKFALDNLDSRIDKLQDRIDDNWDTMNEATRQKTKAALRAIRKQRNQVAEWYGGLQHSSASAWEEMKKGFSDAYTAIYDAWRNAETEFDSGEADKVSN